MLHYPNKRLVKIPKIYFIDVGILCHLTGIRDPVHLASGPMAGPVGEAYVLTEIFKRLSSRGVEPVLYFWRTSAGAEVDIIVEEQGH